MLFIAVDQNLNGGKLRVLAKTLDCSENEARGILINLWIWGISNCRKDGLIIGADKKDIADALKSGMRTDLVPAFVVDTLITLNWIEAGGEGLYIHDWQEWNQIPMEYYSMLDKEQNRRKANADRVRKHRSKTGSAESAGAEEKGNASGAYSSSFESFWKVYPRKVDKGQAYKKYQARLKDGFKPEELQEAAQNYANQCAKDHTEQKYIKHAKTFLGDATPFIDFIKNRGQANKPYDEDNPYAGLT